MKKPKNMKQKVMAGAVSLTMAASLVPFNVLADYSDVGGHWAETAIQKWSASGIVEGCGDGTFCPDTDITRAQMAAIIDRLMKYQTVGANNFADVDESQWYADEILKLSAAGVMQGADGYARPNDLVSRQEAVVMLARALNIQPDSGAMLDFPDSGEIASWADGYVKAMVGKGYIHGYDDGLFHPAAGMTRASMITLIDNMIKAVYSTPGTYTDSVEGGIVIVNSPGVTLKDMKITDIVLAPGVNGNKIILDNSTVSGTQTILSGSLGTTGGSIISGGNGSGSSGSGSSGGGSGSSSRVDSKATIRLTDSDVNGDVRFTRSGNKYTANGTVPNTVDEDENLDGHYLEIELEPTNERNSITIRVQGTTYNRNDLENGLLTLRFKIDNLKEISYTVDSDGSGNQCRPTEYTVDLDELTLEDEDGETTATVKTEAELNAAIADETITTIKLANDITCTAPVVVDRKVTLDGQGHTLTVPYNEEVKNSLRLVNADGAAVKNLAVTMTGDPENWQGTYVMQVYGGNTSLEGLTLTGGDAGLLVNGATVTLTGENDVSGNDFGGIEVSKGEGVTTMPSLDASEATLKNTTEAKGLPTIWTDGADVAATAVKAPEGMTLAENAKEGQNHFFLNAENAPESTVATVKDGTELNAALENETITTIKLANDITIENMVIVDREVTLDGQNHKLSLKENATGWNSAYVLQAYSTKANLNNIALTGGDAGLLVNGATVTLTGTVDVSGNEFGGVEVSKGEGVTTMPSLDASEATLKNTTEAKGLPTIWTDGADVAATVVKAPAGMTLAEGAKEDQNHFFLNAENAPEKQSAVSITGVPDTITAGTAIADVAIGLNGAGLVTGEETKNVRVKVDIVKGGKENVKILATDTSGQEYDIAQIGYWGPENGFPITAGYNVSTPVKATFSKAGEYQITISIIEINDGGVEGETLSSITQTFTVDAAE